MGPKELEGSKDDGSLKIRGLRGGTISEVAGFLNDLDSAYVALHAFDADMRKIRAESRYFGRHYPREFWEFGGWAFVSRLTSDLLTDRILPDQRLQLRRIVIQSPGFWEVVGHSIRYNRSGYT
jgi:hypothetical protein